MSILASLLVSAVPPWVFTKLLKPVLSVLREQGYLSVAYLDDFLLLGSSYMQCHNNVVHTMAFLRELGFIINLTKSCIIPRQRCKYLGYIYNSVDLSISLPDKKRKSLFCSINNMLSKQSCTIREFARFIGTLVAACPAVRYGWLYTKLFERVKYEALRRAAGDYNSKMTIPASISPDCQWWRSALPVSKNYIRLSQYALEIFSDASTTGWGIYCEG